MTKILFLLAAIAGFSGFACASDEGEYTADEAQGSMPSSAAQEAGDEGEGE